MAVLTLVLEAGWSHGLWWYSGDNDRALKQNQHIWVDALVYVHVTTTEAWYSLYVTLPSTFPLTVTPLVRFNYQLWCNVLLVHHNGHLVCIDQTLQSPPVSCWGVDIQPTPSQWGINALYVLYPAIDTLPKTKLELLIAMELLVMRHINLAYVNAVCIEY